MKILTRVFGSLFLLALLGSLSGCMTTLAAEHAKAQWHEDDKGIMVKKSQPAYYALMPLTVPADIATFPFQAVYFYFFGGGL